MKKGPSKSAPAAGAAVKPAASDTGALTMTAWPGKKFVLLEKPLLYCGYGYELWPCPQFEKCRGAIDAAFFTKYRRARCDVFAGRTMTVVSVTGSGAERAVAFRDPVSGKKLYARTADGECREFAYAADRDAAEKRWLGRHVFSARGFVSYLSSNRSVTVQVDLRDSLLVTGVRFGLTPLPAKPLWLMVRTRKGDSGAIPFRFSWTNAARKQLRAGEPWEDDFYETNPAALCPADGRTWETINAHRVSEGMTRAQVRMSWGRPQAKDSAEYRGAPRERWTYESKDLYFDGKELIGAEEK
ncbi:MAG: hypothetical protein JW699_04625 [Chitinispirillaceae bacterium]|nr:hypothetical protein [Chitinispirillaceae bacterium]